ncbi:MAG: replication-relaxation family protein, partial [Actinomycetota bacterium]
MASAENNIEVRALASSLDERDRAILHALLEHKVLTTHQLRVLFFRSLRRCQHRLRELRDPGIVSSFPPPQEFGKGRLPEHYFLTSLGRSVLAHLDGVPRDHLPWVPDQGYRDNKNLRHRMGVNAFFCSLAEASFRHEDHCLERWRPERKVRTKAGEIQPDGFGRYLHPDGACEFYLEYDRATEGITALADKLKGYLRVAAGWGEGVQFPNVLVLVPTTRREPEVTRSWTEAIRGTK